MDEQFAEEVRMFKESPQERVRRALDRSTGDDTAALTSERMIRALLERPPIAGYVTLIRPPPARKTVLALCFTAKMLTSEVWLAVARNVLPESPDDLGALIGYDDWQMFAGIVGRMPLALSEPAWIPDDAMAERTAAFVTEHDATGGPLVTAYVTPEDDDG